jgi:DNA repair protein RAD50
MGLQWRGADGRYTKALDNIRALRKERTAELKVDRERLKFLKADKDKAERVS